MNLRLKKNVASAIVFTSLSLVSCTKDDVTGKGGSVEVKNEELRSILQNMGYSFDADGNLLMDDKVEATKSLDLSGTKLSDFSGLDAFPNLIELKLSNNGYGPVFDVTSMPKQITGIDVTGNDIYDFEGLVEASVEDDEVKSKILHGFTKLYLPKSAKWNVEDLVPFFTQSSTEGVKLDMQMEDSEGKLQVYTTLREIPDESFRSYIKSIYASLFTEDGTKIDISKPVALSEQGTSIIVNSSISANISSVEGVEYLINNPYYKDFQVTVILDNPCDVGYLMPRSNIKNLMMENISTPQGLDLSKSTGLSSVAFYNNNNLTTLDLSNTLFINQDVEDFDLMSPNLLVCVGCPNLKSIMLPENNKGFTGTLQLSDLPELENVDLSSLKGTQELALHKLPKCNILYPKELQYGYDIATRKLTSFAEGGKVNFSVSQNVLDKESTHAFIGTYNRNLSDSWASYSDYEAVRWSKPDAGNIAGVYNGGFTSVIMNGGDKGPVPDKSSIVTEGDNGSFNIHVDGFKIGSMPFPITIDAKDIKVSDDGTFDQKCVGAIIAGPMTVDADIEGRFIDGKLSYKLLMKPMNIEVTFEGSKK